MAALSDLVNACMNDEKWTCCRNWIVTIVLQFVWCKAGCSKDKVARLAFQPPPTSYRVNLVGDRDDGDAMAADGRIAGGARGSGAGGGGRLAKWRLQFERSDLAQHCAMEGIRPEVRRATTSLEGDVPVFIVRSSKPHAPHAPPRLWLLYSHGNAVDCGEMLPFWRMLADSLDVNICGYEYLGFGDSKSPLPPPAKRAVVPADEPENLDASPPQSRQPNEADTYADIEAVYALLTGPPPLGLGVPPEHIIVYGQSVGSGPSCHVASNPSTMPIGALLLHAPLMSGIRVIIPTNEGVVDAKGCCVNPPPEFPFICWGAGPCHPSNALCCCDIYKNVEKVRLFKAPFGVMHGTEDEVIRVSHAHALIQRCPEQYRLQPFIVEGAGHNDIAELDPRGYIGYINSVMLVVRRNASEKARRDAEKAAALAEHAAASGLGSSATLMPDGERGGE